MLFLVDTNSMTIDILSKMGMSNAISEIKEFQNIKLNEFLIFLRDGSEKESEDNINQSFNDLKKLINDELGDKINQLKDLRFNKKDKRVDDDKPRDPIIK